MKSATEQSHNEQASANADASLSDVLAAWEKVYQSIRLKMRLNAGLVAADFRLTLRAIIVTFICILALVGLGLVIWTTTLFALSLGLTQLGVHWGWCVLIVLITNGLGILMLKRTLHSAITSIQMKASCEMLLPTEHKNTKHNKQSRS